MAVKSFSYPDWSKDATGSISEPPRQVANFPLPDVNQLKTITVDLKLETSNCLPFKDWNKAAWTKQERKLATAADCPESLEGFSQIVSLSFDFIPFFHFTDYPCS